MHDKRLGLPSASSRARDSRCPGALNLIRALQVIGISTEGRIEAWTESGTRIHASVAGEELELSHDEESAKETVESRLADLRAALNVPDYAITIAEQRFWLYYGLKKFASGQPDIVWVYDDTAVIPDVKTGWLNAEAEESNLQLRSYGVLVHRNLPANKRVIVALAQAHGSKPQPVVYDEDALAAAEKEWIDEIKATNAPDAQRIPGTIQCKYCPAKLYCSESRSALNSVALTTIHQPNLIVTNEQLASLLDCCGQAEKMIGEIEAEAKRRLAADPLSIPGWELSPGKVTRPITDLTTVFNRCLQQGISAGQFTSACSITKKSLTELLGTATTKKGKPLETIIKTIVDGCTTEKQSAQSLKRI